MKQLLDWMKAKLAEMRARVAAYYERLEQERADRDEDDDPRWW